MIELRIDEPNHDCRSTVVYDDDDHMVMVMTCEESAANRIIDAFNFHDRLVEMLTSYVEREEQAAPVSSSLLRESARTLLEELRTEWR